MSLHVQQNIWLPYLSLKDYYTNDRARTFFLSGQELESFCFSLFQKGYVKKLGHLLADKDSYTGEVCVLGEENGIENNIHEKKLDGPKDVEMAEDVSGETSTTNGNGVWIFNSVYCAVQPPSVMKPLLACGK